jgi:hypothetical protein
MLSSTNFVHPPVYKISLMILGKSSFSISQKAKRYGEGGEKKRRTIHPHNIKNS